MPERRKTSITVFDDQMEAIQQARAELVRRRDAAPNRYPENMRKGPISAAALFEYLVMRFNQDAARHAKAKADPGPSPEALDAAKEPAE